MIKKPNLEWKNCANSVPFVRIWVMSFISNNNWEERMQQCTEHAWWLNIFNLHSLIFGRCKIKKKIDKRCGHSVARRKQYSERNECRECNVTIHILLNATYLVPFIHQLLIRAGIRCGHHKNETQTIPITNSVDCPKKSRNHIHATYMYDTHIETTLITTDR